MMRDALTEEDRQKAVKTIREEEADARVLNGTKSQRYSTAVFSGAVTPLPSVVHMIRAFVGVGQRI